MYQSYLGFVVKKGVGKDMEVRGKMGYVTDLPKVDHSGLDRSRWGGIAWAGVCFRNTKLGHTSLVWTSE